MKRNLEKEEEKMRGDPNIKMLSQVATAKIINPSQIKMKAEMHILKTQQKILREIFDEENC
ncbi:MAG: hypothetical protein ACK4V2_05620 [Pseudomonadota bacterium]|jgi:hypothetical protein|nr:hypothetical protein [Alphaproteobacteria bacterium]